MSSPEPLEDPYLALGVAKDADISAIRSAHRKLVLKFHPDRIKDEAEREKGKDAFQKVQHAYELLSDRTRRQRYDDRAKLAQLKKEAMAREPPIRMGSYPVRPTPQPQPTPSREYRDGRIYEERVPGGSSYFEEGYRYKEEESRTTSRKYDDYEGRPSVGREKEKEKKSSTKWPEKVGSELPYNIAVKLKAKATKTKEAVKEKDKVREKESHASSAKSRDKDQRRDRMDKQTTRQPYVEDDSSSDSDTATFVSVNRQSNRSSKAAYSSPSSRPKSRPEPTRSKTSSKFEGDDDDKWQGNFGSAREYIERSQRPGVARAGSAQAAYWEFPDERQSGKKSGSDSERRPRSSKGRRESVDVPTTRPPPMPTRNSAPVGVVNMQASLHPDDKRGKQRSSTGSSTSPRSSRDMPSMSRSQTAPSSKSKSKGDAVPIRGSNLKHTETQDSGYGSSGGQTPDLSGTSPPRPTPTRYQIVEDEDDARTILVDPEDRPRVRQTRSPSPLPRERDRRDRPQRPSVSANDRTKSTRGGSYPPVSPIEVEPRPSPYRHDSARSTQPRSGSERDPPSMGRHNSDRNGKLFNEIDPSYAVRYPQVNSSPRIKAEDIKYSQHLRRPSADDSDRDYHSWSNHREALRSR